MSDDNFELAVPIPLGLDEFSDQVDSGRTFIPQIKLLQPLSNEVQEDPAANRPGQFIYNGEDNLGNEVPLVGMCRKLGDKIIPCYRPHALLLVDREVEGESFNPADEQFATIRAEALSKKRVEGRAAMFGVDMLFWIPQVRDFGVFYFAKTARRQAKKFYEFSAANKPMVMHDHKIVARYTWWVPKARAATDEEVQVMLGQGTPDPEKLKEAMVTFYGPLAGADESAVEEAASTEVGDRAR